MKAGSATIMPTMPTMPMTSATARKPPRVRTWRRYVPYLLVATGAVIGQVTAGFEHFQPQNPLAMVPIFVSALAIEGCAIWMAYLAMERGRLGENVVPFFVISTAFALMAVGINVIGHLADPWALGIYGGLSLAGYVIWCFDLNAMLDDTWDPTGEIRMKVPSLRILKKLTTDVPLAHRARRVALLHAEAHPDIPGIGPAEALVIAREERDEEIRRTKLHAAIRTRFKESGADDTDVDLAVLAYGPDQTARALMHIADNGELARALSLRIGAHRLAGVKPPKPTPGNNRFDGLPPLPPSPPSPPPPPDESDETAEKSLGAGKDAGSDTDKGTGAAGKGRREEISADPYVLYFDQLLAVANAIPDWLIRPEKITASEVQTALEAAFAAGDLKTMFRKKEMWNRFAWMLEALSDRAAGIPERHWSTPSGLLHSVDRNTLDKHRETLDGHRRSIQRS